VTGHLWSTYQCTDYKQHDECLRCDAKRVRGVNTNWKWHNWRRGPTCMGAVALDMSAAEKRLMARGRE